MIGLEKGTIYIVAEDQEIALKYADKATIKRSKSVNERNTLGGTLNTSGFTTGGTIGVETIHMPDTVQDVVKLENILNSPKIDFVKVVGLARTKNGDAYTRTVTGLRADVNGDEEEWNADDGIIDKLEFNVDIILKESEV